MTSSITRDRDTAELISTSAGSFTWYSTCHVECRNYLCNKKTSQTNAISKGETKARLTTNAILVRKCTHCIYSGNLGAEGEFVRAEDCQCVASIHETPAKKKMSEEC